MSVFFFFFRKGSKNYTVFCEPLRQLPYTVLQNPRSIVLEPFRSKRKKKGSKTIRFLRTIENHTHAFVSKKPYTFGTTKSVCIFGTVSYSFRPPYRRKEERRSRPSNRHSGRRLTRCIVRRSRSSPREPETVCYSPFIQKREKSTYEYLGFTKHVRKKNISQKRKKSPTVFTHIPHFYVVYLTNTQGRTLFPTRTT